MSGLEINKTVLTAYRWHSLGWDLLPVQPGKKILVAGFGPRQNRIDSADGIEFWFGERKSNLAVITPPGALLLDFDSQDTFISFASQSSAAGTYTESTPRGGCHAFLHTTEPVTGRPVEGLELKAFAVSFPSVVEGNSYKIVQDVPILRIDPKTALEGFLTVTEAKYRVNPSESVLGLPEVNKGHNYGLLGKVKENWPLTGYLRYFEPKMILRGNGRWLSGICPWHDDHRPSLWVDSTRDLWGCHACGRHGDVVNWHALRLRTTDMVRAALDLQRYNVTVLR